MSYDNPKGYFEKVLAIDCETTGIAKNSDDPSIGHQAVSWGIIVADARTLLPIEELYVEIKWNKHSIAAKKRDSEFGAGASKIHGLTSKYLEEHGLDEEDAVVEIASLIIKHWGSDVPVKLLGHNVQMFDLPFLRAMLRRHDIEIIFPHRHYDSNSAGFIITGSFTSDALFDAMGLPARKDHNSLEDARMALESCRRMRVLWDANVGIRAYD